MNDLATAQREQVISSDLAPRVLSDALKNSESSTLAWLMASVDRRLRTDPSALDSTLHFIDSPITIEGSRTKVRFSFIKKNPNGHVLIPKLAARLAERCVDFCIPDSRIREAQRDYELTNSTWKLVRLAREAAELFSPSATSGEGGELLLYTLLESQLGVPQLLCKMPFKTNPKVHVHGTDGIHAKVLPNGHLALYWGESKLYADVSAGIRKCFESVSPFLVDETGSVARRDLLLVRDNLDMEAEQAKMALIRYFDEDSPESAQVEFRAGCLVGFDQEQYPDPYDDSGEQLQQEVQTLMCDLSAKVEDRIHHHKISSFEIEVFCLPVPSVADFRNELIAALRPS